MWRCGCGGWRRNHFRGLREGKGAIHAERAFGITGTPDANQKTQWLNMAALIKKDGCSAEERERAGEQMGYGGHCARHETCNYGRAAERGQSQGRMEKPNH